MLFHLQAIQPELQIFFREVWAEFLAAVAVLYNELFTVCHYRQVRKVSPIPNPL